MTGEPAPVPRTSRDLIMTLDVFPVDRDIVFEGEMRDQTGEGLIHPLCLIVVRGQGTGETDSDRPLVPVPPPAMIGDRPLPDELPGRPVEIDQVMIRRLPVRVLERMGRGRRGTPGDMNDDFTDRFAELDPGIVMVVCRMPFRGP
jgi:hypothetical protein